MLDEHVELFERVLVHQKLDALARGQFAALVLRLDAPRPAAAARAGAAFFELVNNILHLLPRPSVSRSEWLCNFNSKDRGWRHDPSALVGRDLWGGTWGVGWSSL